ncbi:MAG: hypothetical protein RIR86_2226 [Acidobacteriota bacterium]|jgi:hypothetical protein
MVLKALKNLTAADKRALAVFFGIALVCAIYFASGILVSYVSPPADYVELAADGRGTMVEISSIPTYDAAIQISNNLKAERRLEASIDFSPTGFGYILRVGPVARREMADRLADELKETGYDQITLRDVCPEGVDCPPGGDRTAPRRGAAGQSSGVGTGSAPGAPLGPAGPVGPSGLAGPTSPIDKSGQQSGQKSGETRP